jgi:steroid 5-alpha reductase family enzyme
MTVAFLLTLTLVAVLIMSGAWLAQRLTGMSGWVDTIWSLGVGLCGLMAAVWPLDAMTPRRWLLAGLILIWSLRLAGHIAGRTHGGGEDPRYAELARQWGDKFPLYLFGFLQIQAAVIIALAVSVRAAALNPAPFPAVSDLIGACVTLLAIAGEHLADAQLRRFAKTHKGGVCDQGLWAWSRHPNYLCEWLVWCGVAIIAFDMSWVALSALIAPVMMYLLLTRASGVPPLEAHMLATRGDAFRAYQNRVPPFLPLRRSS